MPSEVDAAINPNCRFIKFHSWLNVFSQWIQFMKLTAIGLIEQASNFFSRMVMFGLVNSPILFQSAIIHQSKTNWINQAGCFGARKAWFQFGLMNWLIDWRIIPVGYAFACLVFNSANWIQVWFNLHEFKPLPQLICWFACIQLIAIHSAIINELNGLKTFNPINELIEAELD